MLRYMTLTLLILCTCFTTTYALDTIEPFYLGLSDVEVYINSPLPDLSYSLASTFGIGLTETISMTLNFGLDELSTFNRGFGFSYTPINGLVALDIIAGYNYTPDVHEGGLNLEFNLNTPVISQYLMTGIADNSEDDIASGSTSIGFVYGVIPEMGEILFQGTGDYAGGSTPSWSLALGFNILLHENAELITETSYSITDEEFSAMIGLVSCIK